MSFKNGKYTGAISKMPDLDLFPDYYLATVCSWPMEPTINDTKKREEIGLVKAEDLVSELRKRGFCLELSK